MSLINTKSDNVTKYLIYGKYGYDDYYVRDIKDYELFISDARNQGKKLIFIVGDSFTYGTGVLSDETYPAFLSALLNKSLPGKYEVINLGVEGYNSEYEFMRLKYFMKYEPDLIIWQYFNNDMEPTYISCFFFHTKDINKKRFHMKIYNLLYSFSITFERELFSMYYQNYFKELEKISKNENIPVVIFDYNNTKNAFKGFDFNYFKNNLDYTGFKNSVDNYHPNAEYNYMLANRLFSYLNSTGLIRS